MSDPGDEHQNKFDATEMSTHKNWEEGWEEDMVEEDYYGDSITYPVPSNMDTYKAINNARTVLEIISDPANVVTDYIRELAKNILVMYPDEWTNGWIIGNHAKWCHHAYIGDMEGETEFFKSMANDPVDYVPVHGGWIFWNETWSDPHGPFDSYEKAKEACDKYAKELMSEKPSEKPNE